MLRLSVSVLNFTHIFRLLFCNFRFQQESLVLESMFSIFGSCCNSTTVSAGSLGEALEVISTK